MTNAGTIGAGGISVSSSTFLSGGIVDTASRVCGLAAGAIPDFWVGLLLIFSVLLNALLTPRVRE